MINKKFMTTLKSEYTKGESERRQINSQANNILFEAKKIGFSLHRGDIEAAGARLLAIEDDLKKLEKKFGIASLDEQGPYRAATEEYVESKFLYFVLSGQKLDKIKGLKLDNVAYLGGICDMTGELIRFATNQAAAGKFEKVKEVKEIINDIMSELTDFDMTGYLRTKYDQARGNLRRIEQMDYEIKLRK
ncbi:MAG: hypothetical protein WCK37_03005 [Candidatus Falkowbacteria bacterium]